MTGGSPAEAVRTIHASLMRALDSREVRETYQKQGGSPRPMSTEAFRAFLRGEFDRIRALWPRMKISFD